MANREVQFKRLIQFILVSTALLLPLGCNNSAPQTTNSSPNPNRNLTQQSAPAGSSDWMMNAGYGVMVHWTSQSRPQSGGAPSAFCTAVNAFDVNAFAQQLQESGAGYVIFTTSHAQQFFPFPSAKLDSILPGRTCTRDLPNDLYNAITPKGIKMVFYYPSVGTDEDPTWRDTSKFNSDPAYFAQLQYDLVQEVGNRYGNKLAGWWIDNCYDSPPTYSSFGAGRGARYNFTTYSNKLRAGNANRLVTFNFTFKYWNSTLGSGNVDYAAGEEDNIGQLPSSRFSGEGNSQWQTLIWMDDFWLHSSPGTPTPRYTDADLTNYIRNIMAKQGVFSYNAAPYQDTMISSATMSQLRNVNSTIHRSKVDDRNPSVAYSSGWADTASSNYWNGTGRYTLTAGSYVQYAFSGTGVKWYGVMSPQHGKVNVYIDNVLDKTVDLYTQTWAANTVLYAKRGLTSGPHTLKIVARSDRNAASGNNYVEVDALEALEPVLAKSLDDRNAQIAYTGGWTPITGAAYAQATSTYATATGAEAQLSFSGTGVNWYGVMSPQHGKADVYIDGTLDATVDLYITTPWAVRQIYSKTGLASGTHTIRIVTQAKNPSSGNSYVEIDALEPTLARGIDDRDSRIGYTGAWSTLPGAAYYATTTTYATATGLEAQLSFTGTGVRWYGVVSPQHGRADVYIDGTFDATVDLYTSTPWNAQQVYAKTGLANGNHTIRIVTQPKNPSSGNSYVEIDALEYQ
jgi:alpha-L-fucosidase